MLSLRCLRWEKMDAGIWKMYVAMFMSIHLHKKVVKFTHAHKCQTVSKTLLPGLCVVFCSPVWVSWYKNVITTCLFNWLWVILPPKQHLSSCSRCISKTTDSIILISLSVHNKQGVVVKRIPLFLTALHSLFAHKHIECCLTRSSDQALSCSLWPLNFCLYVSSDLHFPQGPHQSTLYLM